MGYVFYELTSIKHIYKIITWSGELPQMSGNRYIIYNKKNLVENELSYGWAQ